jgi:excisionase family DNA binding protein
MAKSKTRPTEKVWLTPQEAVEYTGIGRTRIYALLRTKTISSALVGHTRHIRRTDLDHFMEKQIGVSS